MTTSPKTKPNAFAAAIRDSTTSPRSRPVPEEGQTPEPPAASSAPAAPRTSNKPPSRRGRRQVAAYFDPAVIRQLKMIAVTEESSVQDLVGEALDMLFQSRNKPTIARQQKQEPTP